jgi:hypothetical protein
MGNLETRLRQVLEYRRLQERWAQTAFIQVKAERLRVERDLAETGSGTQEHANELLGALRSEEERTKREWDRIRESREELARLQAVSESESEAEEAA